MDALISDLTVRQTFWKGWLALKEAFDLHLRLKPPDRIALQGFLQD